MEYIIIIIVILPSLISFDNYYQDQYSSGPLKFTKINDNRQVMGKHITLSRQNEKKIYSEI